MHWIQYVLIGALVIALLLAVVGLMQVRRWPDLLEPIQLNALARKNLRRIWILLAGTTIILVGVLIAPLPGPGFILLGPLGLALLATEFAWAKKLVNEIKTHSTGVQGQIDKVATRTALWALPLVWVCYWAAVVLILRYTPVPEWLVWPVSCGGFTVVLIVSWRTYRLWKADSVKTPAVPQAGDEKARDAA
ncbi:MAG: hypothetical protein L6Q35_11385 [Phycisphaerales bacterium]|nr:hypothetical protein [Phycisphaerales bacterium]